MEEHKISTHVDGNPIENLDTIFNNDLFEQPISEEK